MGNGIGRCCISYSYLQQSPISLISFVRMLFLEQISYFGGMNANFFSFAIEDWILMNIKSNLLFPGTDIPWKILFASIIWQVWKHRNLFIFHGESLNNASLLHLNQSWARHYNSVPTLTPHPRSHPQFEAIQWQLAPSGWLTLNVDGSFQPSSSMGSTGGLLRDHEGRWIMGFKNSLVLRNRFMSNSGGFWTVYALLWPMVLNEFNARPIVLKLLTLSILLMPPIDPLLLSDPFPTFFLEHGMWNLF
ncbi:hypothetical protein V6N12_007112 [Hibiscus sabdariffa]|uniref:RNase H type-1 domain-containing protein n=1 Tax=Hibiscus sabdariffa TaxID=183260 RepID=A0ABR2F0V2_9ROSI